MLLPDTGIESSIKCIERLYGEFAEMEYLRLDLTLFLEMDIKTPEFSNLNVSAGIASQDENISLEQ